MRVCDRVEHVARLMRSGGEGISTKVVAFQAFRVSCSVRALVVERNFADAGPRRRG